MNHYSTETKEEAAGRGRFGPAAERLRAERIFGIEASGSDAAGGGVSMKVPTRLRTMWCRKPQPVTR